MTDSVAARRVSRENGRYLSRLRRSWFWSRASAVWLALGLMPLLFLQTTVHEGSHCMAMELAGIGCRVLAPFPVTLSVGSIHGITIGWVEYPEVPVLVMIAPQLVAAALIPILLILSSWVHMGVWAVLTRLWLLGACLDLLNNTFWRPHAQFGDWSFLAGQLGLSLGARFAVSLPMWLIGLTGLFLPLPTQLPRKRASVPDLSGIGLVYAGISSVAIFVSLTVQVPDSNPESLWHRVPILLHAATVAVCLAIFAAARRTRGGAG